MTQDIYERLALHLSTLGMGLPYSEELLDILKENYSPVEAEVALALPTKVAPLQPVGVDDIASNVSLPKEQVAEILEELAKRGLLFTGKTTKGERGYALHQVGMGFPQTWFWKGEDTPHARNMANLVGKYFRKVTKQAFASSKTQVARYIPVGKAIDHDIQAVFSFHMMETVIRQAKVFAVGHCPCRMMMKLQGRGCDHPTEVCLKFDETAQYLIERELAREITREEALEIVKKSEEAGLVHFVDNALGHIQHGCNCCGCACWNVGNIRRKRIPRDVLMATYFIRKTDKDKCIACGHCVEVCPVNSITIRDEFAAVDEDWCIGCGVCVAQCPSGAATLVLRADKSDSVPPRDIDELHKKILEEKGLI